MNSLDHALQFTRSGDTFHGLSNLSPGFPLLINGFRIPTCEHLFQALKFPDHPELQQEILTQTTDMGSRTLAGRLDHRSKIRSDWEDIRSNVMTYCLRAKLIWNWVSFGKLLREAEGKMIVENSSKIDRRLGVVPDRDTGELTGDNHLGQLLMDLRNEYLSEDNSHLHRLTAPNLGLKLGGEPLQTVDRRNFLLRVGTKMTAEMEWLRA